MAMPIALFVAWEPMGERRLGSDGGMGYLEAGWARLRRGWGAGVGRYETEKRRDSGLGGESFGEREVWGIDEVVSGPPNGDLLSTFRRYCGIGWAHELRGIRRRTLVLKQTKRPNLVQRKRLRENKNFISFYSLSRL